MSQDPRVIDFSPDIFSSALVLISGVINSCTGLILFCCAFIFVNLNNIASILTLFFACTNSLNFGSAFLL